MPAEPPPFDLTLAREAFDTAARLHGEATRRGAGALAPVDFDRLRAADRAFVAAVRDGRVRDAIAEDDNFHQVLIEAAGDPDLQVGVELLLPRLRRMDLWFFTRKTFDEAPNSHPPIIAALEDGDGEQAARLVEQSFLEAGEQLAAVVDAARSAAGSSRAGSAARREASS
jgi:DNA-binding GntR family transcriptional regulator